MNVNNCWDLTWAGMNLRWNVILYEGGSGSTQGICIGQQDLTDKASPRQLTGDVTVQTLTQKVQGVNQASK